MKSHYSKIIAAILSLSFGQAFADDAEPLKIGVLLPTSGVLAAIGKEQLNGMQIAIDEAGGSVVNRPIELIVEDTEAKPDVGLSKTRKLILSNKVDVLAGTVSSSVALAVAPYVASRKVPFVISNSAANQISGIKCNPFTFRVSYSSKQVGQPIGEWMAKNGVKDVFILASDYVAPHEFVDAFKEAYIANGGNIVGEAYPPFRQTQDYGPYIAQARSSGAQAMFAVFFGGEAILFVKQYESYGMDKIAPLYSTIGLAPLMLRGAQGDAALNITASLNYVPELETPVNANFVKKYMAKFGSLPSEFAVMGHDTIRFIIEAVKKRAGDTSDRDALVREMEKVSFVGPRGPLIMDPATHSAAQNIYITKTVQVAKNIGFEVIDTMEDVTDPVEGCSLN